jgi:hypothetical protein
MQDFKEVIFFFLSRVQLSLLATCYTLSYVYFLKDLML